MSAPCDRFILPLDTPMLLTYPDTWWDEWGTCSPYAKAKRMADDFEHYTRTYDSPLPYAFYVLSEREAMSVSLYLAAHVGANAGAHIPGLGYGVIWSREALYPKHFVAGEGWRPLFDVQEWVRL